MYLFFVEKHAIFEDHARITGSDVNHIKNVLRMKVGEKFRISDGSSVVYDCSLREFEEQDGQTEAVLVDILSRDETGTELPAELVLYQGLPKGDKMELIIQKTVELGISRIVPVSTKRAVVKLDAKKEDSKVRRWNAISESAAKQSKRTVIPSVEGVHSFREVLAEAEGFDLLLMPYENAEGMAYTRRVISQVKPGMKIAIFIGPEGGFDEAEVEAARSAGFLPLSLGKRILRTETAGFTLLAALMLQLDERNEDENGSLS